MTDTVLVIEQGELAARLAEYASGVKRPAGMSGVQSLSCMPEPMAKHFEGLAAVVLRYIHETYSAAGLDVQHATDTGSTHTH